MKFMNSLQCLMGGNAVQFQDSPSSSSSPSNIQSSNDKTKNVTKKKKKTKKKNKDGKVIKVFKPDGEINLYHKPVMVSEVMTEECMVCRSDSFYIGQKIPPLAQHDRLQPGHTYFLLPAHLFHSVLSFVTIASFTTNANVSKEVDMNGGMVNADSNMKMKAAFLKKAAASSCPPFDIQKTASGTLRIRVSELFISQLIMDQHQGGASSSSGCRELIKEDLLCTTPQLHKEYKQLVVGSRRGWKPKLEMIKESPTLKGKRKVKMLLSASFNRVKRKLKKPSQTSLSSSSSSSLNLNRVKRKKKITKTKKSNKPASPKVNKFSKQT